MNQTTILLFPTMATIRWRISFFPGFFIFISCSTPANDSIWKLADEHRAMTIQKKEEWKNYLFFGNVEPFNFDERENFFGIFQGLWFLIIIFSEIQIFCFFSIARKIKSKNNKETSMDFVFFFLKLNWLFNRRFHLFHLWQPTKWRLNRRKQWFLKWLKKRTTTTTTREWIMWIYKLLQSQSERWAALNYDVERLIVMRNMIIYGVFNRLFHLCNVKLNNTRNEIRNAHVIWLVGA